MEKKKKLSGSSYYKKLGLTKGLLVFLKPRTAIGLSKIARYEERAMQTVIRRALEQYVKQRWGEIKRLGGDSSLD